MMKVNFLYISLFFLGVLVAWVILRFNGSETVEVVEHRVTDTIIYTKHDTVVYKQPVYITKLKTDTVYVKGEDGHITSIPISSYFYHEENVYDLWVKGFNVDVDSIKLYPQTKYVTITNNVEVEKHVKRRDLYATVGFKRFSNKIQPNIGLLLKTKKEAMLGVEIGYDPNNSFYYGFSYGLKLNKHE